jgi:LPXTG-motif cell wall-anchored protein
MKLSTKKKLGRKFASLLCISLIGVHLSQAAYASDEIVYQWDTDDMRSAINNVTKDNCHNVKTLFGETNLNELRGYFNYPDDSQDLPDLLEYFDDDSDVLYELGIEEETMSAHLLATGDTDSSSDDNKYKLAEDDWLIIYLHANPGKRASILLGDEEIVNVPLNKIYVKADINILNWRKNQYDISLNAASNISLNAAPNISLGVAPNISLDAAPNVSLDAVSNISYDVEAANNTEEADTPEESANVGSDTDVEDNDESADDAEIEKTESVDNAETEKPESVDNTETEKTESADNTETEKTESANNTDDKEIAATDEYSAGASEKVALSISHHDVPLLADSEDDDDIETDNETETDYELTIDGSWYELVYDGMVIGIPVAGILSDEEEIAAPIGINLMNDTDETPVTENTHSGGGGGGSDSDDSDSTPSGMTAASTEETTAAEQSAEAESETSEIPEIPEKPIYPELPDISGKPDGTPDIPEGTEVEIYDLDNPSEPVYHGSYSDDIDLPAGRYEIVMLNDEGVPLAAGIFTIDEEGVAEGKLPKTGDASIPFVLLSILLAGSAAGSTILIRKIRQSEE